MRVIPFTLFFAIFTLAFLYIGIAILLHMIPMDPWIWLEPMFLLLILFFLLFVRITDNEKDAPKERPDRSINT